MGNRARIKPPIPGHCEVLVGLFKKTTNVFPHERTGIWMPDTMRSSALDQKAPVARERGANPTGLTVFCKTEVLNSREEEGEAILTPSPPLPNY